MKVACNKSVECGVENCLHFGEHNKKTRLGNPCETSPQYCAYSGLEGTMCVPKAKAPLFTTRHYEAAACFINDLLQDVTQRRCALTFDDVSTVAHRMCTAFQKDNPKFKAHLFIKAASIDFGGVL